MAAIAEHAAGVFGGGHLGEPFGFGRVLFVAAAAEVGDVGQHGFVGGGIVDMLCLRAVACLAGDVGVFAGGAGFPFVFVAEQAHVLAGEGDGPLADGIERAGAIVAVPAEVLGYDGSANNEKKTEPGDEHEGGSD